MRLTLVFKNIREEHYETWGDTCKTVAFYHIRTKHTLSYSMSYDDIDLLISWPHRGAENQEDIEEQIKENIVMAPGQFLCYLPTGESWKKLGTRS